MKELEKSIVVKKLGFDLLKRGDIYYFEGPYLSHFNDERGFDYFMNWLDVDSTNNRWLLFHINKETLNKYFSKKVDLLTLIKSVEEGIVYIIDIDKDANYSSIQIVSVESIPDDYMPAEDSYFDPKHCEPYALQLAAENKRKLKEGENSFIEKAVKVLFEDRDQDFGIDLISSRINKPWSCEPNFINEVTIAQSLVFPLIVHYHNSRNRNIRDLIMTHSQAYASPETFRSYLTQVHNIIVGESHVGRINIINPTSIEVESLLDGVVKRTASLVKNEPEKYAPYFNDWLDSIKTEYNYINDLRETSKYWRKVTIKSRILRSKKK